MRLVKGLPMCDLRKQFELPRKLPLLLPTRLREYAAPAQCLRLGRLPL